MGWRPNRIEFPPCVYSVAGPPNPGKSGAMQPVVLSSSYNMSTSGTKRLDQIVDRIQRNPGRLIGPTEFDELQENLDLSRVLDRLPLGMTEADLIGILRLTMLTECATETYAAALEENARRYDAAWLYNFTHNVWTPDELTHAAPYKLMLLHLGFEEAELDRQIRDTRAESLEHRSGETPMHLTAYGMLSEYATEKWHGAIWHMLRESCPRAAYMAARVKRRETLHRVWYHDMTAAQIDSDPGVARYLSEVLLTFRMPGASLVPELQREAGRWLVLMQWDFEPAARELGRMLQEVLGDSGRLGRLLITLAAQRGEQLGPLSAHHVQAAIQRLRGAGYGLIGEAFLESVGLRYLFPPVLSRRREQLRVDRLLRGLLRSWIADRIRLDMQSKLTTRETMS